MKKKEVIKILEDNKITNVGEETPYTNSLTKIIHTKTFYCDGSEDDYDKHPRVHYTFDNKVDSTDKTDKGYVVCEYCYTKFVYKEKTHSEEMQDELEPIITAPMMDME